MPRNVTHHATHEEATAAALEGAQIGEVVEIHDETCKAKEDDEGDLVEPCTCEPLIVIVNGEQA